MKRGRLSVRVLGTSFEIQADETSEYLEQIYAKYVSKVEEVRRYSGLCDPLRISIVAGILIADELEKECLKQLQQPEEQNSDIADSTRRIIDDIDKTLRRCL